MTVVLARLIEVLSNAGGVVLVRLREMTPFGIRVVRVRKTEPMKVGNKYGIQNENYAWLWNLADHDTRFILASRVSKRRNVEDARAVFQDGKKLMVKRPLAAVHDGLHTYHEAFNREFYTNYGPRIENVRSVGQRDEGLNQMVE
jgi:transposase-like protein